MLTDTSGGVSYPLPFSVIVIEEIWSPTTTADAVAWTPPGWSGAEITTVGVSFKYTLPPEVVEI